MTGFRVGLTDLLVYTGLGPMAMTRANYLAAAATRIDSFWVLLLVLFPAAFTRRSGLALGGATAIAEPSDAWATRAAREPGSTNSAGSSSPRRSAPSRASSSAS